MPALIEMTTTRRAHKADVHGARETRLFDAVDKKGRQFGAMVRPFTCTYETVTEKLWDVPSNHEACARARPAGVYFGFRCHAMRAGRLYGASQHDRIFATEAERDAAIVKYFASAERGALKNKARAA